MPALSRVDNSVLGRWWFTVDRWTLFSVATLIGFGYVMMLAASPAVAERIHVSRDAFIIKQVVFLIMAGAVVVGVSLFTPRQVRRLALVGCAVSIVLTAWTIGHGVDIKGARRWINLPGMSLQPSEFIKPCFAVTTAWLLSETHRTLRFPGMLASGAVFAVIALLLKSQPDMGMLAVVGAVFFVQLFLAGLNVLLVGVGVGAIAAASVAAYAFFPHVRSRVTRFLDPATATRSTPPSKRSATAACSGAGPAKAASRTCCPTPMPTSCFPSWARSSACWSACSCSACSHSSCCAGSCAWLPNTTCSSCSPRRAC